MLVHCYGWMEKIILITAAFESFLALTGVEATK